MKTLTIKTYKFEELSEEVQNRLIENYTPFTDYIYDDAYKTVKKFNELFDISEGSLSWLDFKTNFDENVEQLTGLRLRKYIINNYGYALFKHKYIGNLKNREKFTPVYSKIQKDNCCVLTGVCYDDSMLMPIYKFIEYKNPIEFKNYTIEDLIEDCFDNLKQDIEDEVGSRYSESSKVDELINEDKDYLIDGREF